MKTHRGSYLPGHSSIHFDGHLELDGEVGEADTFSWSQCIAFAVGELIASSVVSLRCDLVKVQKALFRLSLSTYIKKCSLFVVGLSELKYDTLSVIQQGSIALNNKQDMTYDDHQHG